MRSIILIFTLTVFQLSHSQSCKYDKNEVDEFTNSRVIITKEKPLTKIGMGFGTYLGVKAKKVNSSRSIVLKIYSSDIFTINDGDLVMFKTKSGEIIKLPFTKTVVADYIHIEQMNTTRWIASNNLILNDDDYKKLCSSEIIKVRWYTSDGYVEKKSKKKQYKNLQNLLKCIE